MQFFTQLINHEIFSSFLLLFSCQYVNNHTDYIEIQLNVYPRMKGFLHADSRIKIYQPWLRLIDFLTV